MIATVLGFLAQVTEEAPSSISTSDQVRAAVVLGACLLVMILFGAFAVRQSRRRRAADRSGHH